MMSRRIQMAYLTPRNPHKIYLLTVCTLGGIIGLAFPDAIGKSVGNALPEWALYVWIVLLVLSSGIALFGSWKATLHGANLERLGLSVNSAVCAVWAVAVIGFNPVNGWGAGLFYGGFAVANIARIRILNRGIRQIREDLPSVR